jgi:rSAM/selenodomain-associated transferase 1
LQNALIILVKNPVLGKVKTRLAKTVGDVNALKIYQHLLRNTQEVTAELTNIDKFIFYDEYIPANDIWNDGEYERELQKGNNLSEKFINVFNDTFQKGYEKVIVLMPDCPNIKDVLIKKAFNELNDNDIVIGPTTDGGFYLLGLKKLHLSLFENKEYSTPTVTEELKTEAKNLNLSLVELPTFTDVDTEEDLGKLSKLIK